MRVARIRSVQSVCCVSGCFASVLCCGVFVGLSVVRIRSVLSVCCVSGCFASVLCCGCLSSRRLFASVPCCWLWVRSGWRIRSVLCGLSCLHLCCAVRLNMLAVLAYILCLYVCRPCTHICLDMRSWHVFSVMCLPSMHSHFFIHAVHACVSVIVGR